MAACAYFVYQKIKVNGFLYCKQVGLIRSLGLYVQVGVISARESHAAHTLAGRDLTREGQIHPTVGFCTFSLESGLIFRLLKSRWWATGGLHRAFPSSL